MYNLINLTEIITWRQPYCKSLRTVRTSGLTERPARHNISVQYMNCSWLYCKFLTGRVQDRAAANCNGSIVSLHSPSASIWTETLRACAPGAAVVTSAPGKGPPPIVLCNSFDAVLCSASAYWSRMSKFVCMRHASLCSCIAAVIAWSLDNVPQPFQKPRMVQRNPETTLRSGVALPLICSVSESVAFPQNTKRGLRTFVRKWSFTGQPPSRHRINVSSALLNWSRSFVDLGLFTQNVPEQEILSWCGFHNVGT